MLSSMRFLWQCWRLRGGAAQSPERLQRLQAMRLRQLLRLATERTAFFQAHYRGLDLERCRLSDLPPTNKADLMEHFDQAVTDPNLNRAAIEQFIEEPANRTRLLQGKYVVSHTSGSQGQPLLLVQEQAGIDLLFALQFARGNAFSQVSLLEALRRLREPARLAVVGMKPGFYPSSTAYGHFPEAARRIVDLQFFAATDVQIMEKLNGYRPHVIIAYASILDKLALRAAEFPLAPVLQQVVNCSETLPLAARQRIESAFHVPVLDSYATGECLFLSQGCPAGPGAHINADWAILEVVDEHYRPVPPGELGKKVLVTNLFNRVQPFIRYELGDMLALSDAPCACGSRLPKIAHIEGRTAEFFWVGQPGNYREISAMLFKNAADYLRDVRDWQAVQEERNRVQVRLVPLPGAEVDLQRAGQVFTGTLRHLGLPAEVEVGFTLVPELHADPRTHKLRHLISRVDKPAGIEGPAARRVASSAATLS